MTATIQLALGGTPVPSSFYTAMALLEVQESAERPGALVVRVPVNRTSSGDLQYVGDGTFEPYTSITVVVTPGGGGSQCIFDGYVLSWKLMLDRSGRASSLEVWAQDASWLMNLDDSVVEWPGMTDGQVANSIFSSYGFVAADGNTADDSPAHDPDAHSLFQRSSDLQFLRGLARRGGKLMRVAATDTPGVRTGYFVKPTLSGTPSATISLIDPATWTVDSLEFDWDVMRPSAVDASQLPLDQSSSGGVPGDASASDLQAMGTRDYPTYAAQSSTIVLTAAADAPDLPQRTTAVLREAGWFVRCKGEVDVDRIGAVLRVGSLVAIAGAGSLHSGNWLVWDVRHRITRDNVKMDFTLVRNAVGPPSPAGGSGGGLLGGLP